MSLKGNEKQQAESGFVSALRWFSYFAAAAIAFVLTPLIHTATAEYVWAFTTRHYGADLAVVADIVWFVIIAGQTFFGSSATTQLLVITGGIALAARFAF